MTAVTLEEVGPGNWREAVELEVEEPQRAFVAEVARYLAMCAYGGTPWHPLVIRVGEQVVGFVMWGVEEADGSFWIGGLVIDRREQRKGYGRAVVEQLLERARREGRPSVALSYRAENLVARGMYAGLGFVESGETEGDELVARLTL